MLSSEVLCKAVIGLLALWAGALSYWKDPCLFALSPKFSKYSVEIFPLYISSFIVSEKKLGQRILVTLTTYHSPVLMSCNDTSCTN
jgi:hypothetical protein